MRSSLRTSLPGLEPRGDRGSDLRDPSVMSRFALRFPYFIIVLCLITCVVGSTSVARMPVDLFPPIRIPVVVVATFFSGMPPEQIETDITGRFERFFTLASGVDHIESRSLPGVSLIKIYFQPGFDADSAVTSIANLAVADLRKLPPGTLPPVVLKFDASSLPVCLVTLKGAGLNEARLRDLGQYDVRNQIANVPGASVPQPFGGRYRQIMVYVDPLKLQAHQLSVMDVVRAVNEANLILPAGDVKIGPYDYNLYANSQINAMDDIDRVPLKTVGNASVLVADVGKAAGCGADPIQYRARRRTALGVSAGTQAGRRCQYHRSGRRNPSRRRKSAGCSQAAHRLGGIRSVAVRAQRHREPDPRGRHRPCADRHHDSCFPGQPACHGCRIPLDTALGARRLHRLVLRRQHDQYHDPGGPGARVLAPHRQFRGGAGKHLSTHGDGRTAGGGGGARRRGSAVAGAGGHAHHGDRFLPGDLSLWREPISVHRAGTRGRSVAGCLLFCRHDRGAAVLCALDQGAPS